jgi:hypothetical protein
VYNRLWSSSLFSPLDAGFRRYDVNSEPLNLFVMIIICFFIFSASLRENVLEPLNREPLNLFLKNRRIFAMMNPHCRIFATVPEPSKTLEYP